MSSNLKAIMQRKWLAGSAAFCVSLTLSMGLSGALKADETNAASKMDDIWSVATLYEMDDTKIALSGRLQADAVWVDENSYDDRAFRRFRFGAKAELGGQLTLHVEADFDLNDDFTYTKLTDANISWKFGDGTKLKVLKQSAGFTLDGATSSKRLITTERNNLTNNLWFTKEYFTGVSLAGSVAGNWSYQAAVFANDDTQEISGLKAGYFSLLSLAYSDTSSGFGPFKKASFRVDYVYNDEDEGAGTREFEHIVSVSGKVTQDKWGLAAEVAGGKGYASQSDLWGLVIMPSYDFSKKIQIVGRYTYMNSDGKNGIRLNRYEDKAAGGRGDEYSEFYGGLNYYLYGHKLKFQLGVQYTDMDDKADDGGALNSWSTTLGFRLSW